MFYKLCEVLVCYWISLMIFMVRFEGIGGGEVAGMEKKQL